MKGFIEELQDQFTSQITQSKTEFQTKLKDSEKKLNSKDLLNKETLINLFEEMESLKLRVQTLENKLGITPVLSSKKSPFDIDEAKLAAMESNLPESEES